jgi:hypothetical protein
MVSSTRRLPRYPVNNIMEPITCTLQVPFSRVHRKKDVATGVALLPKSGAMYSSKPIPPDYARVDMTWTNFDYGDDEIDIPTTEGFRYMRGILGMQVLWNKSDIVSLTCRCWRHNTHSRHHLPWVTMTTTMAAMTTTMLATQAALLHVDHLSATEIHREVQGQHRAL